MKGLICWGFINVVLNNPSKNDKNKVCKHTIKSVFTLNPETKKIHYSQNIEHRIKKMIPKRFSKWSINELIALEHEVIGKTVYEL